MRSIFLMLLLTSVLHANDASIRSLAPSVFTGDEAKELSKTLSNDYRRRIQEANLRESQAWNRVSTKAEWEAFRDTRIAALRSSLGEFPAAPQPSNLRVTGTIAGDGYRVEKLIYETRPGFYATANLYLPAKLPAKMPGLMVIHAHHTPCTHSELQDLGIGWARVGCAVLVPELVGHGERRQHAFRTEADYPKSFRPSRQDYYFRANTGKQLQLVGDSLMGWFAWDLSRGLDVLLGHAKADPDRMIVLGAVAGGGDPAGVLSAIDPRVSAVVPYNFGGGQPDYSTPEDTDRNFYWFGYADWESTRALRLGARDGFAQWVIAGAAAPKPLILAHEFAWEAQRDPAWPRFQKVYGFYGAVDKLGATVGRGSVKGKSGPENTHCTHIGDLHRSKLDPYFEKWFGIAPPKKPEARHSSEELACWTDALKAELRPRTLHEAAGELFNQRVAAARHRYANLDAKAMRDAVAKAWAKSLGGIDPTAKVLMSSLSVEERPGVRVHRFAIEADPGVPVPCLLLQPRVERGSPASPSKWPVVVMVAQAGKTAFLKERAREIEELLQGGVTVCLVDVRGTGETQPSDGSRGRNGSLPSLSASEWLLGQTLVGSQLRDLRAVLRTLAKRPDVDDSRIAVWGDSFAKPNAADRNLAVPLDVDQPTHAEPLGGLLAMFAALYEPDLVKAVYVRGGLVSYRSALDGPYLYLPHDAILPGAANAGDLGSLAAAIAPKAMRIQDPVDARNRSAKEAMIAEAYRPAVQAYHDAGAENSLLLRQNAESPVAWMLRQIGRK